MNSKIKPSTLAKILELRRKLQQVSDISFAFSQINKKYFLDDITDDQALEVIKLYQQLLTEVKNG